MLDPSPVESARRWTVEVDRGIAAELLRDGGARSTDSEELLDFCSHRLRKTGLLHFSVGRLGLGEEVSRRLALAVVEGLGRRLRAVGAPDGLRAELAPVQPTVVPCGSATRTLLPHHDGGHNSFLTPSLLDMPDWDPRLRCFGAGGSGGSPSTHKLYQGIFVLEPGSALSVTAYYPWVRMLALGHRRACGRPAETVGELARWVADNLRRHHRIAALEGLSYPSVAGVLGSGTLPFQILSLHRAEEAFSEADLARFSELRAWIAACPCGECAEPTLSLFCRSLVETLGLTWPELNRVFGVFVSSERHDLLLGHNLVLLHAGLVGGPERLLQPICLVVDEPAGPEYESWLAESWRMEALA